MILILLLACSGGVIDRITDPDNMIHDYEWFHTASTHIESRVVQINSTENMILNVLTSETDELNRLRVELAGQRQSCRELVADYNANSAKATKSLFRGWSLPESYNMNVCE